MRRPAEIEENKRIAIDFLKMVVGGQIEEAYQKHVDMTGKHHNLYFKAGFPALKEAMIENHKQFPVKQFTPKNVLGDGDLVAVHSRIVLKQDDPGISVVHIFKFHESKIVEMWDIGQEIPHDMPNEDGAI
jgi:predicted SnoaL-like aldol condensation-catalyzing enzyme